MPTRFLKRLKGLHADERGMTTVEYAIVLCLIAALSVGLWGEFGKKLKTHLGTNMDEIDTQLGNPGGDK